MGFSEHSRTGTWMEFLRERALFPLLNLEIRTLLRSRLLMGWIAAAMLVGFVIFMNTDGSPAGGLESLAQGLSVSFVLFWSLFVIALSAASVSAELGGVADSILSKAVKRYEYIASKILSRVGVTLLVFGAVSAVWITVAVRAFAWEGSSVDLTTGLLLVALSLAWLAALGVFMSVLVPRTMVSFVSTLAVWFGYPLLLSFVGLGEYSPTYPANNLAAIIEGTATTDLALIATLHIATVFALVALSFVVFYRRDL
ncbi:MAG: ABC transporter permease [Thermoplasmata archaeon]